MAKDKELGESLDAYYAKKLSLMKSLMDWEEVDLYEPQAVRQRCDDYFALMAKHKLKPLVAGLAMALGMDRRKLHEIVNGYTTSNWVTHIPQECKDIIKKAYDLLEINWELDFVAGKINPVSGIFMSKNNYGYRDQTEVVVEPKNPLGEAQDKEELEKRLLASMVE